MASNPGVIERNLKLGQPAPVLKHWALLSPFQIPSTVEIQITHTFVHIIGDGHCLGKPIQFLNPVQWSIFVLRLAPQLTLINPLLREVPSVVNGEPNKSTYGGPHHYIGPKERNYLNILKKAETNHSLESLQRIQINTPLSIWMTSEYLGFC